MISQDEVTRTFLKAAHILYELKYTYNIKLPSFLLYPDGSGSLKLGYIYEIPTPKLKEVLSFLGTDKSFIDKDNLLFIPFGCNLKGPFHGATTDTTKQ